MIFPPQNSKCCECRLVFSHPVWMYFLHAWREIISFHLFLIHQILYLVWLSECCNNSISGILNRSWACYPHYSVAESGSQLGVQLGLHNEFQVNLWWLHIVKSKEKSWNKILIRSYFSSRNYSAHHMIYMCIYIYIYIYKMGLSHLCCHSFWFWT
jgi:hypothetical protein